jgi:hypothetical protein
MLRQLEPSVPVAVITLVDAASRGSKRGYFAKARWHNGRGKAHEIAISPTLAGEPSELLQTMLHEAAHAILHVKGRRGGIGSMKYYHTREFRDECLRLGLACQFRNTCYGWNITSWPPSGIPKRYSRIVTYLGRELPPGASGLAREIATPKKLPRSGMMRIACQCKQPRRVIQAPKSVLAAGGILCAFCKKEFRPTPTTQRLLRTYSMSE